MIQIQSYHVRYQHAAYYAKFSQENSGKYAQLDQEYPQILAALQWISSHLNTETAQLLIGALGSLEGYFQQRARYNELLSLIPMAIRACDILNENPVRFFQLKFKSHYALGNWKTALEVIERAVSLSTSESTFVRAESLQLLGTFQLNRGDYRTALQTLAKAEALFQEVNAIGNISAIMAEQAAFRLNRGQYQTALQLYIKSDTMQREARNTSESSSHMLLMLGVVYRRLHRFQDAEEKLLELSRRASYENNRNSAATAKHHLGWVYMDQGDFERADMLAYEALEIYQQIDDLRGQADAYEQLGEIEIQRNRLLDAINDLSRSLQLREQLGNRHGMASSLKRLGRAYLYDGQYGRGGWYTARSLFLYFYLNMLSKAQLRHILSGAVDGIRNNRSEKRSDV